MANLPDFRTDTRKKSLRDFLEPQTKTTYIDKTMVVGIGIITFRIHDCRSLKQKRRVVKALIRQIQNNFNASVAEVGAHDIYQKTEIGFALAGNDQRRINSKSDKILNMLDDSGLAELLDNELEIIHL